MPEDIDPDDVNEPDPYDLEDLQRDNAQRRALPEDVDIDDVDEPYPYDPKELQSLRQFAERHNAQRPVFPRHVDEPNPLAPLVPQRSHQAGGGNNDHEPRQVRANCPVEAPIAGPPIRLGDMPMRHLDQHRHDAPIPLRQIPVPQLDQPRDVAAPVANEHPPINAERDKHGQQADQVNLFRAMPRPADLVPPPLLDLPRPPGLVPPPPPVTDRSPRPSAAGLPPLRQLPVRPRPAGPAILVPAPPAGGPDAQLRPGQQGLPVRRNPPRQARPNMWKK